MSHPVELYIYDLSGGMARQFGPMLAPGLDLEGVWHTAIVVYNTEWFWGGGGIERTSPGSTMLGRPLRVEPLGQTSIDRQTFVDFLTQISREQFAAHKYDLFRKNCNNFSEAVAQFLCNKSIPQYILDLPGRVLGSPIAQMLQPILEQALPHGEATVGGVDSEARADDDAAADAASARAPTTTTAATKTTTKHFPPGEFVAFRTEIDVQKATAKLSEMSALSSSPSEARCAPSSSPPSEADVRLVTDLLDKAKPVTRAAVAAVKTLLSACSSGSAFPAVDVLRWKIVQKSCIDDDANCAVIMAEMVDVAVEQLRPDNEDKVLFLSARLLTNVFSAPCGPRAMLDRREALVAAVADVALTRERLSEQTQIAMASLLLNFAQELLANPSEDASVQMVSTLCTSFIRRMESPESVYRALVTLGTLAAASGDTRDLALALDAADAVENVQTRSAKIIECIAELRQTFTV